MSGRLRIVPIRQRDALAIVRQLHRHNPPPPGDVIRVAVKLDDRIVGVGLAGRPVSRVLDDGATLEITRVATDGTFNACSLIYGRLRRAGFALGYTLVFTYTRADEPGASLRAAGFVKIAERSSRRGWDTPTRPRDNSGYDAVGRVVWEARAAS